MASIPIRRDKISPPAPAPPIPATAAGALIDSFYRSSMNAILNAQLTRSMAASSATGAGTQVQQSWKSVFTPARLFPNMHIQIPARIVYINGIKIVRAQVEQQRYNWMLSRRQFASGQEGDLDTVEKAVGAGCAILPGVVMTPMSSLLEASNAGHMVGNHIN